MKDGEKVNLILGEEDRRVIRFAQDVFEEGTMVGDIARAPEDELDAADLTILDAAYEGWLRAGGRGY